jgi:acetoin utilization protein AcuC
MISVHEDRRWPFTGALTDMAGGASFNLPVKRGFNDSEFGYVLEKMILPAIESFRPEAIFLQCGADAVTEDPLARLCLSNQSHWRTVSALKTMSDRLIVSGGGGYNPWTVGRLWTGVWATLNEVSVPDQLPSEASAILRNLAWARKGKPDEALLTTLADVARNGAIDPDLRQNIRVLTDRIRAIV